MNQMKIVSSNSSFINAFCHIHMYPFFAKKNPSKFYEMPPENEIHTYIYTHSPAVDAIVKVNL